MDFFNSIIIITKSYNNYCSVGVMELCLLDLLILIDCFLCNSYPSVLFESLSHVINQESHVYSWNLGKIYLVHFFKFWNLPRFTREILKFQKSELGKFIRNFPVKHVITSSNILLDSSVKQIPSLSEYFNNHSQLPSLCFRRARSHRTRVSWLFTPFLNQSQSFLADTLTWNCVTDTKIKCVI